MNRNEFKIRLATEQDMPRLRQIYAAAREFMRQNGNPTQWTDRYPLEEDLWEDIRLQRLYVVEEGHICACFMLCAGPDDTYTEIYDGAWGSDRPYGVLHRVASDGTQRGIVSRAVAFAARQFDHLRIDTHADNLPMQRALAREGFVHRGTITVHDGTPRLAYDRIR